MPGFGKATNHLCGMRIDWIRQKDCSIKIENPLNNKICVPIYFCDENTEDFSEKVAKSNPIKITMKGN